MFHNVNIRISSLHKTASWNFLEIRDTSWALTAVEPAGVIFSADRATWDLEFVSL